MPPQRTYHLDQKETRIQLATQDYKSKKFRSLLAATEAYDVAYSIAYDRLSGRPSRVNTRSKTTKLTPTEELALI